MTKLVLNDQKEKSLLNDPKNGYSFIKRKNMVHNDQTSYISVYDQQITFRIYNSANLQIKKYKLKLYNLLHILKIAIYYQLLNQNQ